MNSSTVDEVAELSRLVPCNDDKPAVNVFGCPVLGKYDRDVSKLNKIDIYRVLALYDVTDPCLQHAVKKLLCAGKRGSKDATQDIREALNSLQRYFEMQSEVR